MKKICFFVFISFLSVSFYAQTQESDFSLEEDSVLNEMEFSPEENEVLEKENLVLEAEIAVDLETELAEDDFPEEPEEAEEPVEIVAAKGGLAEVPPAKRPKPIDKEKAQAAAEKDESDKDEENFRNTIRYGIPSEIGELLDKLIKNEDPRFTEEIYDVFHVSKNSSIKEKVLRYFTKLEDPCLEDYAVDLLNDPYDEKNEVVSAVFQYISAVKTRAACPAVVALIESENENYFNAAITALGDIGGPSEALFLVEYLDRDDLSDAQRQALMRTCGKMHAVETWDKLVDVLENEDENTFVRMYAAESLGLMKVEKSIPVLVRNFDVNDPNLRQYIIKGLSNYPENKEAKSIVIQGIRDEHWKVRQESINSAKDNDFEEAVPYLIYRGKNDSEKVIKDASFTAISVLNTDEGNDYLVGLITDKKTGDATKKKVIEVLLKEGHAGEQEILNLAIECCKDDKKKDLRYAIGKELAKYSNKKYADVCLEYLSSKDTTTISLGLDMYKTGKYESVEGKMREIAAEKKGNANIKNRIKKMLNIEDEDESEKKDSDKKDSKKEKDDKKNDKKNPSERPMQDPLAR